MVYKITTQEELDILLNEYYGYFPEHKNIKWWSGCNAYRNTGNIKEEPIGTATSIHECGDCDMLSKCKIKQKTPIWLINDETEKKYLKLWNEMITNETK